MNKTTLCAGDEVMDSQTVWRRVVLHGLFSVFLFTNGVTASLAAEDFSSHAYALYPTDPTLDKISPLYRISLQQLTDQASISQAVTTALAATKTMPIGHRAFLNLDLDFLQIAKTANLLTGANGKPLLVTASDGSTLPDHGIWLDKGITAVAARVSEFFRQYKAAGGLADFVSLDYRALALTADDIKVAGEASGNLAAYLQSIQTDTRFAAIQTQLGFSDLMSMYAGDAQAIQRQQIWNAVMKARMASYLNQAFYTPLQAQFKSVQVMARDQAYYAGSLAIPGENTKANGVIGNGQSKTLTGQMPTSGLAINQTTYAANAFNAFRYEVNRLRSSALASSLPLHPYLTDKSQAATTQGYTALLVNSDLYQEMLLHAGLTGARKFVYFNGASTPKEDALVNKVFREFDQQVGTTAAVGRLIDNGVDWTQPFVLTPANTATGKIWRFTPKLAVGTDIASITENTYPAKFALEGGLRVTVPGARLQTVNNAVSNQGVWLREDTTAALVACPAPVLGQSCVAYYKGTATTTQPALLVEQSVIADDSGNSSPLFVKNWNAGGPDAGVGVDGFTAQYNASLNLLGGDYRFTLKADDSVRLWVDGALVLDGNATTAIATRTLNVDLSLAAGAHTVRLQYTDINSNAAVDLSFKRLACGLSSGKMCLTFVDKTSKTLVHDTTVTQTTNGIQFDFSKFSFPQGIDLSTGLLMRWDGLFNIAKAGDYAFEIRHGLGALNIWVDGILLYSNTGYSANVITQALQKLSAGDHRIRVELKAVTGSYLDIRRLMALSDCKVVPQDSFCGEFFDNMTLAGGAKRFQATDTLNFDWGNSAPVTGGNFPVDKFSARWVGDFTFEDGNYTFTTTTDDGVRVWLDDRLVIDSWKDQWNGVNKQGIPVSAGKHRVKMEYYENGGGAVAKLGWVKTAGGCTTLPDNKFCAEYYANNGLADSPAKLSEDTKVDFTWKDASPMPDVLPVDKFSVRWQGNFDFVGDKYRFIAQADDGIRVWIDGNLVINQWQANINTEYTYDVPLTAGKHLIKVEYHEETGSAAVRLSWEQMKECSGTPVGSFCGSFFDGDTLTGTAVRTQATPLIDFDWGTNRPMHGLKPDLFSARWLGQFDFKVGYYRFIAEADDGIRVWVDDVLVIDHWSMDSQWQGKVQAVPYIAAGKHSIKVEYRESYNSAKVKLDWQAVSDCTTTPENAFCMELYNNKDLTGFARQVLKTDTVNFDWAEGQPDPMVAKDNFSARWTGKQAFGDGYYRFVTDTDQGVRLWVDNTLVIDKWAQQNSKQQKVLKLAAGLHTLKMEYFDSWSVAKAKLNWEKLPTCNNLPENQFCGEFYATPDFSGDLADLVLADQINFDWAGGSPSSLVPSDRFSVRWTGNMRFDKGLYRFLTDVDDGVKVWIDDKLLIDAWVTKSQQRRLFAMTAGLHKVKVEYREDAGSAKVNVGWEKAIDCSTDIPQGKFCASFYNTKDLSGEVADNRYDDTINFDWGSAAPQIGVNADNFSTRWQGKFDFAEGEYTFTVRTDDGFRLWVDDKILIDAWKLQGATTYTKRIFLTGGTHTVKAEYYEATGQAVAQMSWKAEQLSEPQIPTNLRTTTLVQDKVTLVWDNQPIVNQYKVYKGGELLTTVSTPTATDIAVEATKIYNYAVSALWPNGKESRQTKLTVTVPDTQAPTIPVKLAVQALTPTSVTLVWEAATDNIAIKGYQVWRDNLLIGETSTAGFVDNTLQSAGKYSYKVTAIDTAGNISAASVALSVTTKDGTGPTTPTGLTAEVLSATQIALAWEASSDNVGVASYRILRNGVQIGTSTLTRFTDTKAAQDTLYRYQVVALDAAGNMSAASAAVEAISGDGTPPSAPSNLTAQVDTAQHIRLEWNAATDNKAVTKYRIMRDGRLLGMTALLTYTDTSVQVGHSYSYTIKALDAAGNVSLDSNMVTVNPDGICETTQLYYQQHVESSLNNCITCHVAGGMGQNTRFILSTAVDASTRNLGAINSITQALGKQAVLDKVSGKITHGGGAVFTSTSTEYAKLATLLGQLETPGQCNNVADANEPVMTASLVANCASCHGTGGISSGPATPALGGMGKQYLGKVLADYRSGARASTVMGRIAKGYSADELNRLVEFFAQQPFVAANQATDAAQVARGRELHNQYCASCHNAEGKDVSLTGTRLAGQWKPYMQHTLKDYATGRSQTNTKMADAMNLLYKAAGDNGILALTEFYASNAQDKQPPDKPSALEAVSYTPTSTTLTWKESNDDWGILYYEIYRDGIWIGKTRANTFTDPGLSAGNYRYTVVAVDIFANRSVTSDAVTSFITSDEVAPDGVVLLNYPDTLRKASLLLLNRLPTPAETDAAKTEESFRVTLRQMMDVNGAMDPFVYRAGHEAFLSSGAATIGSNSGLSENDFPAITTLTGEERNAASDAERKEPVFLLQYLVGNDKPWTEVLTADYTVTNPQLAKAFGAIPVSGGFTNAADAKELRPVRIPQVSARYPGKAFAHAGVLSTNAWLSRFPTTDTNRNRHRAAKVYKQFMALDIEALAQRPLDDSKNGDYRVPTMQNPNCMVCHTIMEPVAGAFRDWGNNARYLQNFDGKNGIKDSLSGVYKSDSYPLDMNGQPWYHAGDTWYRDMFPTGFNTSTAPGGYGSYAGASWTSSANLLQNPSAENGVTGWTVNKGVLEASNTTKCSRIPNAPKTGVYLYQVGSCNTLVDETLAWQTLDISSSALVVDQGKAEIDFGAYFSSLKSQDTPSVWVEYFDKADKSLGKSQVLTDKPAGKWTTKTATEKVPKTTRKLRFTIQGLRSTQVSTEKYTDAYLDDLFLILRTPDSNALTITGAQDNLQWLGKQLIQDPRFAKGGVYFWYKPLFKREPLKAPVDPNAANYATQMAAYNAQDEILTQMASRFAYDQGHGAWNVKDLLINLTASPLFRAKAGELSAAQQQALPDTGLARLLTPEELNAKVKSLMSTDWYSFRPENVWNSSMGQFYGGFDGGRIQVKPNTDMNSLMSNIPERMAIELSCNAVADDFRLAANNRKLFPFVEATDTPVFEIVDTGILNLLVNSGAENGLNGWSIEQGTARVLSGKEGTCDGGPSIKSGKAIFNPGSICTNPTPVGRLYQEVDATAWDDSIDTGQARVLFGAALRGWSVNNDEASVYLSFRDAADNELGVSQVLSGKEGYWKTEQAYAPIPPRTRSIRFYMQGKRIDTSTNPNNDSFVDDTYLRVLTPDSGYMPVGEKRVRANLQYLYRQFLNEKLALDDPEITRSFNLFSEVWAKRNDSSDATCRLYASWEDPNYTKRAWGVVLMYLMNDARFLYE